MALYREIELPNGVVVRYHRVVSVNTITNVQNIVEVASYTSQEKREEERVGSVGGEPTNVYVDTCYHGAEYDQAMTVESAYEWLKANVPDFADAEDVLETEQISE